VSLCTHCGSKRVGAIVRADVGDDAAWAAIAKEHDMPCGWVLTRGKQLRPVFTLLPHDGNRRTATRWCVGQLGTGGTFVAVTEPLQKAEAEQRETEMRRAARRRGV
jgi:hypothetical protein